MRPFQTSPAPPALTLTSITPARGSAAGGENVTIVGSGFMSLGATAAKIGGASLSSFTVVNDTHITGITTSNAPNENYSVKVFTPSGNISGLSYTYSGITSISPIKGTADGGTAVTIFGYGFSDVIAAAVGSIGVISSFHIVNDHTITGITHSMLVLLNQVVVRFATGLGADHIVTHLYTGVGIYSISPNSGPTRGGFPVTITGIGFLGATSASIGGVKITSFSVVNDTTITGIAAEKISIANTVDVTVAILNGCKPLINGFTYVSPPLALNVDASILSSFSMFGDGSNRVTHWIDQSGNARTLRNLTSANMPVYEANSGPGSRPTVEFIAFTPLPHTDANLTLRDYLAHTSFNAVGNGYTVIIVVKADIASTTAIFGHQSGAVSIDAKGFDFGIHITAVQPMVVVHSNITNSTENGVADTFSPSVFRVISIRGGLGYSPQIRVNNVPTETLSPMTYVNAIAGSADSLFISNEATNGSVWVCEVQYFDGIVANVDISPIETALMTKWGI